MSTASPPVVGMPTAATPTVVGLPVAGLPCAALSVAYPANPNAVASDDSDDSTRSRAPTIDHAAAAQALRTLDTRMPPGLSLAVAKAVMAFPLRIMIVDNSGSMQSGDGNRLVAAGTRQRMLSCTRWAELSDDVLLVAKMAEALGARTDFHLLNPRPGADTLTVSAGAYSRIKPLGPKADEQAIKEVLKTSPGGTTPLTEAVMRVVAMIEPHARELRACGETVTVILATDGLPNDSRTFELAMQQLQRLPVWLVVRLCTDDDKIVEYWNSLDEQLEMPLEVLDDLQSEAQEVTSNNGWLTYAPQLHTARLFGLPGKLFDAIDETALTPSMIKEFIEDLLGCSELPEPEVDANSFVDAVRSKLRELPEVLNPRSMQMQPWVDVRRLSAAIRGNKVGCAIM